MEDSESRFRDKMMRDRKPNKAKNDWQWEENVSCDVKIFACSDKKFFHRGSYGVLPKLLVLCHFTRKHS